MARQHVPLRGGTLVRVYVVRGLLRRPKDVRPPVREVALVGRVGTVVVVPRVACRRNLDKGDGDGVVRSEEENTARGHQKEVI